MAQRVVTKEAVAEYLIKHAGSKIPTVRELREVFGGGSLETMSRGLRLYLQGRAQSAPKLQPSDFAERVEGFGDVLWKFWEPMMTEAFNKGLRELKDQNVSLMAAAEAVERECDDLRLKDEGRAQQLADIMAEAGKLGRELGSTQAKLEAAQAKIQKQQEEIAALQVSLKEAEAERAKAQGALEAFRQMTARPVK